MVRQVPEVTRDRNVEAALAALQAGQPARAEVICRERLAHDHGSLEFLRLLGQALVRQSRLAEAEEAVRKAVAQRPAFAPCT